MKNLLENQMQLKKRLFLSNIPLGSWLIEKKLLGKIALSDKLTSK